MKARVTLTVGLTTPRFPESPDLQVSEIKLAVAEALSIGLAKNKSAVFIEGDVIVEPLRTRRPRNTGGSVE